MAPSYTSKAVILPMDMIRSTQNGCIFMEIVLLPARDDVQHVSPILFACVCVCPVVRVLLELAGSLPGYCKITFY